MTSHNIMLLAAILPVFYGWRLYKGPAEKRVWIAAEGIGLVIVLAIVYLIRAKG